LSSKKKKSTTVNLYIYYRGKVRRRDLVQSATLTFIFGEEGGRRGEKKERSAIPCPAHFCLAEGLKEKVELSDFCQSPGKRKGKRASTRVEDSFRQGQRIKKIRDQERFKKTLISAGLNPEMEERKRE